VRARVTRGGTPGESYKSHCDDSLSSTVPYLRAFKKLQFLPGGGRGGKGREKSRQGLESGTEDQRFCLREHLEAIESEKKDEILCTESAREGGHENKTGNSSFGRGVSKGKVKKTHRGRLIVGRGISSEI